MLDVCLLGTGGMMPLPDRWPTHYSPSLIEPQDYIDFAINIFENTKAGHDLMTKSLIFE